MLNKRQPMFGATLALTAAVLACTTQSSKQASQEKQSQMKIAVSAPISARGPASGSARGPASTTCPKSYVDVLDTTEGNMVEQAINKDFFRTAARAKLIFDYARNCGNDFFKELRERKPFYAIQGASAPSPVQTGIKKLKGLERPIPNILVISRYKDVVEALNHHDEFAVHQYRKVMDPSVGPFMLGHESSEPNAEKPGLHHLLNQGPSDMERVKKMVRKFTREAIKAGTNENGEIDVIKSITRDVPVLLNSDYFGFPGPDTKTMKRWSYATQHSYFHNSPPDDDVDKQAVVATEEMRKYITEELIPSRLKELNLEKTPGRTSRPVNDTLSRLLYHSAQHSKYGLKTDRLVTDTMGLLVGSVETTSAAVAQVIQFLLENDNPNDPYSPYKQAMYAVKAQDANLFAAIVWEALRFDPVNPWVAREATVDYTFNRGTKDEYTVTKGTTVLIATQSAMHDEDVFTAPETFRTDRDISKMMLLGYGYHECLGNDVALAMVPTMVSEIMSLPHIKKDASVHIDHNSPFPESMTLKYDASVVPLSPEEKVVRDFEEAVKKGAGDAKLASFILENVKWETREALSTIRKIIAPKNRAEKIQAINQVPKVAHEATQNLSVDELVHACAEVNPLAQIAFPDKTDRYNYCHFPMRFRACYLVERKFDDKTPMQSFSKCAYELQALTSEEYERFKSQLSQNSTFEFLGYAEESK